MERTQRLLPGSYDLQQNLKFKIGKRESVFRENTTQLIYQSCLRNRHSPNASFLKEKCIFNGKNPALVPGLLRAATKLEI
jgi:hypothetical protein